MISKSGCDHFANTGSFFVRQKTPAPQAAGLNLPGNTAWRKHIKSDIVETEREFLDMDVPDSNVRASAMG